MPATSMGGGNAVGLCRGDREQRGGARREDSADQGCQSYGRCVVDQVSGSEPGQDNRDQTGDKRGAARRLAPGLNRVTNRLFELRPPST